MLEYVRKERGKGTRSKQPWSGGTLCTMDSIIYISHAFLWLFSLMQAADLHLRRKAKLFLLRIISGRQPAFLISSSLTLEIDGRLR